MIDMTHNCSFLPGKFHPGKFHPMARGVDIIRFWLALGGEDTLKLYMATNAMSSRNHPSTIHTLSLFVVTALESFGVEVSFAISIAID